ncbi:hypothetical protein GQ53DRAFT_762393 [Thozetella sp. PMI_491]|nr:hypothetical protein GQ53DRAFT_762393 [Thozetella sp. PMI_491]
MPQPTPNPPRASRSRFSSPLPASATPNEPSKTSGPNSGTGGQQTLLGWLEPPVNMKASYQDAGLMRHGVVGNMAPLGTMPKVGIFKKAAAPPPQSQQESHSSSAPTPVRKIIIKQRANTTPPAPTPTAASVPAHEADETEEEEQGETDIDEMEEDIDLHGTRSISGHHSHTGYGDDDLAGRSSSGHISARGSLSHPGAGRFGSVVPQPGLFNGLPPVLDRAFVDKIVALAVDEALRYFRYPTAYALRMLYDEQSSDPDMLCLFARWLTQTASGDDLDRIARLMHPKKREGARDHTAYHYFVPPPRDKIPPEWKPSPHGDLVHLDISKLHIRPARPARPAESIEAPAQPAESNQTESDGQAQPDRDHEQGLDQDQGQLDEAAQGEKIEQLEQHELGEKQEAQHSAQPTKSTPRSGKKRRSRHADSASKMSSHGVNGKVKTDSPPKRRGRRDSQSSSSTLSSARSMSPPEDVFSVPTSRASPAVEEEPVEPAPLPKRRRPFHPRRNGNVSPPDAPPSPTASQPAAEAGPADPQSATFTMPEALNSPMFPSLNGGKKGKGNQRIVFPSKVGTLDENDELSRLRRRAKQVSRSEAAEASFSRGPTSPPDIQVASDAPTRTRTSLPTNRLTTPAPHGRNTRSARKRSHDEIEEQPSPTVATFPASEVGSTAANSRAGTPAARAAKKPRTSLRIKNSPIKKKGSTAAGIPRASGERSSPVLNGAPREDENDDYCTSCSGSGELVCCDGCTRSLHLSCIDPPLPEDSMPPQWFCNECRSKHQAPRVFKGPFRELLDQLEAKNSSAFILPKETREKFDGVKTGPDGEYEEVRAPAPKVTRKKKNDEEAGLEFHRLRDPVNDDKAVLCHACGRPCSPVRPIVPCPDCGLYWHLDCVDPPMANVPVVLRDWRCPAHVDDLLKELPGALGPAHKHRKIKGAAVIQPAFSRGNLNNGFIEVLPDYEADELSDFPPVHDCSGWRDVDNYGKTIELSGTGIQKDFMSRIRRNRKGKQIAPLTAPSEPLQHTQVLPREALERQLAAHTLAELSGGNVSAVDGLIDALVANADPAVYALMVHDNSERLAGTLDPDSLQRAAAMFETWASALRSKFVTAAAGRPTTPANDSSAIHDGEVPSLTNSQSSSVDSEHLAQDETETSAADVDIKKNLPSPAATDVNSGTQLDENPKDVATAAIVASELKADSATTPPPAAPDAEDSISVEVSLIPSRATDSADAMDLD